MADTDAGLVSFVVTIIIALLFSTYMLLDPAQWLAKYMQLTDMTVRFKVFILVIAAGGFTCAWIAERRVFLWVAHVVGMMHDFVLPHRRKRRKRYKTLRDEMRI